MKKSKYLITIVAMLVLIVALFFEYNSVKDEKVVEDSKKISMIVYGDSQETWEDLKMGAYQAAKDYNAEINFVVMSNESNAKEQTALIEREIRNGAEGIIIAPVNSEKMTDSLDKVLNQVPIVEIYNYVDTKNNIPVITANNYEMGETLANIIDRETRDLKILVIVDNMERNGISDRLQGFEENIKKENIEYWNINGLIPSNLVNKVEEESYDVVIAFDKFVLETTGEVIEKGNYDIDVYGMGNTTKIVDYLDREIIDGIIFQNEFNVGYISVENMISYSNYGVNIKDIYIEYKYISSESLYDTDNQRLLFPDVQ